MNKLNKLSRLSPFWLVSIWAVILLVGFLPSIPQPSAVIGYLWKAEFALAALILLTLILALKFSTDKLVLPGFDSREVRRIILPLILFTAWSGFSCIWAESLRNALHHTLLWACYVLFYLLIRQISFNRKLVDISFAATGVVVSILGLLCLIEYFSTESLYSVNVSLRYSKYAEAIAALLPVFIFLVIDKKRRDSILFGGVALVGWIGIVCSLGRTQFLAALAGIFVFAVLIIFFGRQKISLKKAAVFTGLFVLVTVGSQFSASLGGAQQTTINRFTGDEQSQTSFQVRFLFWRIALENFKQSPLLGVGADNYISKYETARTNYAATESENPQSALYEDLLPERAHNEFLQILSELGVVGAALIVWLLFGIAKSAWSMRKKSVSLLPLACLSGMCALFVSSLASSYSFRVPANGVCFFFLLALALRGLLRVENNVLNSAKKDVKFDFPGGKRAFVAAGLLICTAMMIFSVVRGISFMYLQAALRSSDESEIEANYHKAIALDENEGLFKYYYAVWLYNTGKDAEAIPQMRFAVDRGNATSISYFYLASAQIGAKQTDEAEKTLLESLRIYPRSVFLRTFYAAFLKENDRQSDSEIQLEKAVQINPKQAKSWWLAVTDGTKRLNQTGNDKDNLVEVMELKPAEGIYALLDFQRRNNSKLMER